MTFTIFAGDEATARIARSAIQARAIAKEMAQIGEPVEILCGRTAILDGRELDELCAEESEEA